MVDTMKTIAQCSVLACMTFALALLASSSARALVPVNPNASPEAAELLRFIDSLSGKYTLSGQHNYPGDLSIHTERAKNITGSYPVVWGQDFGFTASGQDGIDNRQKVIDEAIRQHKKGAIITLMWHAVRPIDDEPDGWKESVQNDLTDAQWQELVTPGTELHNRWLGQIDVVAEFMKKLRDHHVPVLWRPYHEMNGGWFWWGDKRGEDGYVALWKAMYDRYVNHHELNNVLWVWNPNAPRGNMGPYHAYFPGLQYVDILAADVYGNDYKQSHHDDLLELAGGKPIALGECGRLPTPEILAKQPQWTWFMCWTDFLVNQNEPDAVRQLYQTERVLTLDPVRAMRGE